MRGIIVVGVTQPQLVRFYFLLLLAQLYSILGLFRVVVVSNGSGPPFESPRNYVGVTLLLCSLSLVSILLVSLLGVQIGWNYMALNVSLSSLGDLVSRGVLNRLIPWVGGLVGEISLMARHIIKGLMVVDSVQNRGVLKVISTTFLRFVLNCDMMYWGEMVGQVLGMVGRGLRGPMKVNWPMISLQHPPYLRHYRQWSRLAGKCRVY